MSIEMILFILLIIIFVVVQVNLCNPYIDITKNSDNKTEIYLWYNEYNINTKSYDRTCVKLF